jgi:hypothetical protein
VDTITKKQAALAKIFLKSSAKAISYFQFYPLAEASGNSSNPISS